MENEKGIEVEKTEGKKTKCTCEKHKNLMIVIVLVVIVLIGFGYYKLVLNKGVKGEITLAQAKVQAEEFINGSLMQPGSKAQIGEIVVDMGMFKIPVTIGEGEQKQEINSYMSLDGKKFFPSAPMDIEETKQKIADEKTATAEAEKEIPKTIKPVVDLYVMAFCPFGNKAEDTIKPVYDLLKNKVDFNFHYIVSSQGDKINSLHGEPEVVQNEREACVLKNNGKDKWMGFVTYVNKNCGSDGACWEAGAKSLSIDSTKITACVISEGASLMKANEKKSTEAGATGSPTMKINGVDTKAVYEYGNSESYKKVICGAFEKAPAECMKVLESATATTAGGSCATN